MYKATWNDITLAESSRTIEIEGNQYFPPEDVKLDLLSETSHHTTCPWKGLASYYTIEAEGKSNENAAWFYKEPKDAAKEIAGYVAFWKGVSVSKL